MNLASIPPARQTTGTIVIAHQDRSKAAPTTTDRATTPHIIIV